ncbi:helix-turn-helix domain-containing protein [Pantoea dispersa]
MGVCDVTIITWIDHNYFTGEAVVDCVLNTGFDCEWFALTKYERAI